MGQAALSSEYWRPANPDVVRLVEPVAPGAACRNCGNEYSRRANFCHLCGADREQGRTLARLQATSASELLELRTVGRRLGLSLPCVVFFVIGVGCIIAAALIGFIYKADSLADWQALQTWRIEWLLGASAALLAGILLKIKDC